MPRTEELQIIPARMLNEFVYCARLYYYEHVIGEFEDNADTVEGRYRHRRVDQETGTPPSPEALDIPESEDGAQKTLVSTSVWLEAPHLGATCKIDRLEIRDGLAVPVDYKRGKKPDVPGGAWEPEQVQVALQALVLRENGYKCEHAEMWYAESRERVRIPLTDELVERTQRFLAGARAAYRSEEIPPPLEDSPKCPRCSLVGICLPDETRFLKAFRVSDAALSKKPRRLVPEKPDAGPLYVQQQGMSLGKSGDVIEAREKGKVVSRTRLLDVSQVAVYGNVSVSTPLVRELCDRGISISYLTYGGWFVGMARGGEHKNVGLRIRQHRWAEDSARSLELAREFVRGKILNSRTMLRRNHAEAPEAVLLELKRLAASTSRSKDLGSLLGTEGAAAKVYFRSFPGMLKSELPEFDFQGRNRRPPRDPINALLSFAYSLLTRELTVITASVGFDPYRGFFHQSKYGKPALALDLMEEFRPLIADSVVLQVVNNGEIQANDFVHRAGACALLPNARRKFIEAYERRMTTSVTHPVFDYSASYRRILEIQARLLGRLLQGEIERYPAFRTR